jgi:hypothetical protein
MGLAVLTLVMLIGDPAPVGRDLCIGVLRVRGRGCQIPLMATVGPGDEEMFERSAARLDQTITPWVDGPVSPRRPGTGFATADAATRNSRGSKV